MMNQEDLFKKIGLILSELQDQYQFLSQNPQNLNELELELFLANANFLTDHVQIVKKANSGPAAKAVPDLQETKKPDVVALAEEAGAPVPEEKTTEPELPAVSEPEETEVPAAVLNEEIFKLDKEPPAFEFILKDHAITDKFEFEEKEVGEIFDRPLSKEEEQIIAQKQKLKAQQENTDQEIEKEEDDEIGPEPFLVSAEQEQEIAAVEAFSPEIHPVKEEMVQQRDLFEEKTITPPQPLKPEPVQIPEAPATPAAIADQPLKPTLNELLGNHLGANLNTESYRTEITDLKSSISLNDKLLYIKDLFNGYNLAYAEVIDLINKMPDFKTVDAFLQKNYAGKNDWASKQATADRFYELLNRRFPAK